METKDILKYFLENSNDRANFLQYCLASNSVLEWFGRTVRGNKKIEQFFRYDILPQYEQNFTTALPCQPFENKPTHFDT